MLICTKYSNTRQEKLKSLLLSYSDSMFCRGDLLGPFLAFIRAFDVGEGEGAMGWLAMYGSRVLLNTQRGGSGTYQGGDTVDSDDRCKVRS